MALDLLAVAFVSILACLWWFRCLHSGLTSKMLPRELRAARLVYAERLFRSIGPVSITAKVDRAYRNAAGELVLLEMKTRWARRAYLSDVIELSAQRVAVMAQMGEPVAVYAYVLIELPKDRRTTWRRVQLIESEKVTALALRREALLTGEVDARRPQSPRMCRACHFCQKCQVF